MAIITLFGYICRDRNVLPDGKQTEIVGGKGLFSSAAISRTGGETKLITWLPESDRELLRALKDYPIQSFVIPIPTGTVNTNRHIGDTTIATTQMDPCAIEPVYLTQEMQQVMKQSDAIHLSPDIDGKISLETVRYLHKNFAAPLSLDAGKFYRLLTEDHRLVPREDWPDKEKYLPYFHTLFLSREDVILQVSAGHSLEQIASGLAALGPREIIITLGSKGSVIYDAPEQRLFQIPAYPPKRIYDPTGLGDTYLGAYLGYRFQGHDCEQSGNFAAMAASAKLNYAGPLRETVTEIEAMLSDR